MVYNIMTGLATVTETMARTSGSRNKDFEASRRAIAEKLCTHLRARPDPALSFRQFAELAGVSVPTLRHYFGDVPGVLGAVLKQYRADGEPHIRAAATQAPADLAASLTLFAAGLGRAWALRVGAIHQVGLLSGLGHPTLGPAYVDEVLEPTVQALESRLAMHVAQGLFPACDLRYAALAFVSPLLVVLLHQDTLGGHQCRPLDLDAFAREQVARFIRAWGPVPAGAQKEEP